MPRSAALVSALALLLLAACSERSHTSPAPAPAPASPAAAEKTAAQAAEPARRPDERPLPAFEGPTLDGKLLSISSFIGKRLVIFFFNPHVEEAGPVADAVGAIAKQADRYNFAVVGVAEGAGPDVVRPFATAHGLDFPVIDDSGARIANRLGLRVPVALLGVDAEGYLSFGVGGFPKAEPAATRALAESRLREGLRLPEESEIATGVLLPRPPAPPFTAEKLGGGTISLADYRGRPLVLIFFLSTCPHCHHALALLKEEIPKLPEKTRPAVLGVEVSGRASGVKSNLEQADLDFFDVAIDSDGSVRDAYGVFGGVPVILLIDAEGRIVYRHPPGWVDGRDPQVFRMRLAKLAGAPVPMLLDAKGYTGSDVCGICHEVEHATWEYTQHAGAYDTIVSHAADRDPECVSCHVVGFGKPGGFSLSERQPYLEGVGCEDCHGRGGPHLTPSAAVGPKGSYESTCRGCHDAKHSLGFDYATFEPKISHAAIAALSPHARAALVANRRKPRDVLPTRAKYVGSEACQSCHPAEYATWSKQPHAHAGETLVQTGHAKSEDCLHCHTTGYGRPGGFPKGGALEGHADLGRVGCEDCHGPGGDHVPPDAPKTGTIVSLGDKCDSCVILQICGSCHDEKNDPGFEFAVKKKIEAQRHGTREPRGEHASLADPRRLMGHAFAEAARAGWGG